MKNAADAMSYHPESHIQYAVDPTTGFAVPVIFAGRGGFGVIPQAPPAGKFFVSLSHAQFARLFLSHHLPSLFSNHAGSLSGFRGAANASVHTDEPG